VTTPVPDRRRVPREVITPDAPLPRPASRLTVRSGFLLMAVALAVALLFSAAATYYAAAASRRADTQSRQTEARLSVLEQDLAERRAERDAEADEVDAAIEHLREQLAADRAASLARLCAVLTTSTAMPGDPDGGVFERLRRTYCP